MPECFTVRHLITTFQPQKSFKTCPVNYLKFELIIGQIVQALKNYCFEKNDPAEQRTSAFAFIGFSRIEGITQCYFKNIPAYC